MRMPNKRKAFELTELCYDNLETALALTDLLSKNLVSNKKSEVVIDTIASNIKCAVENILEIQNIL